MKHLKSIIAACMLLVLHVSQVSAEELCNESEAGNIVVVFANGMMQTQTNANRSLKHIHQLLKPIPWHDRLEFVHVYNSYGGMSDLYELFKQQLGQEDVVTSFWSWLNGLKTLPDGAQNELISRATSFDASLMVRPEDIANQVEMYRTSILCGKTVLMVSHGEGNYVANAIYDTLYNSAVPIPDGSFEIIAIATPTSFVAGDGYYLTLQEDAVIASVSLAKPSVLPPNMTNGKYGPVTNDWLKHGFNSGYVVHYTDSEFELIELLLATIHY
jgi:hypothetical protein